MKVFEHRFWPLRKSFKTSLNLILSCPWPWPCIVLSKVLIEQITKNWCPGIWHEAMSKGETCTAQRFPSWAAHGFVSDEDDEDEAERAEYLVRGIGGETKASLMESRTAKLGMPEGWRGWMVLWMALVFVQEVVWVFCCCCCCCCCWVQLLMILLIRLWMDLLDCFFSWSFCQEVLFSEHPLELF